MRAAARDVSHWDAQHDVIVVGLGCAGAAAAIEAGRAGADVLVLEGAPLGGGSSAASHGLLYLGGGTALQQACGFEDTPEAMFAYPDGVLWARPGSGAHRTLLRGEPAALPVAHRPGSSLQGQLLRWGTRAAHRRRSHLLGQRTRPPLRRDREAGAAGPHPAVRRALGRTTHALSDRPGAPARSAALRRSLRVAGDRR